MAEDRSSGNHRSSGVQWWQVAAIFGGVILFLVSYLILVFSWLGEMETRGQFGDLFGGLNALFTGLAFAGVICTILYQSNELKLQREELQLQREELKLNRAALERSANAQDEQVARLEEAAELSAISTLVNTYGALLQPLRDSTHRHGVEITRLEAELDKRHLLSDSRKEALQHQLNQVKSAVRMEKQEWADILPKEQELVERLETLVEQRSQHNGEAQEPE